MKRSIPPGGSALRRSRHVSPELLPRHELLTRVTQLEMSRTRKRTELAGLQTRVSRIEAELATLDDEVSTLMTLAMERDDAPRAADERARSARSSSGFKLRY